MKKKTLIVLVCCMALLIGACGVTLAWFTDQTAAISNTFTVGDIAITLDEAKVSPYGDLIKTGDDGEIVVDDVVEADRIPEANRLGNNYMLIPGYKYIKDPTVTVVENSEDCILFIKFEELNNDAGNGVKYIEFTSALEGNGWRQDEELPENVWYRTVSKSSTAQKWELIRGNEITINDELTKAHMAALEEENAPQPELRYTAYAIQKYKTNRDEFRLGEAWEKVAP